MSRSLQEQMLLAICKPEDKIAVPYAKTSDGKGRLHKWEIDPPKSAENCAKVAQIYALEQQIELLHNMHKKYLLASDSGYRELLSSLEAQLKQLQEEQS